MMANNSSSLIGSTTNSFSKATNNGTSGPQQPHGSSTLLFSHANRRESFGAPSRPGGFTPGLGVSQLIHHQHGVGSNNSSGLMNSSVSGAINNNTTTLNTSGSGVSSSIVVGNILNNTSNSASNNNNNRNSLSGSFSQQNRKRVAQTMLPPRSINTFHNILGTSSSQKEDVLSPEETICKTNPLDEALVKENAELKKENEDLKQQLQKLKAQMIEREKEMVDKEDQLKKAQFASKELTDCKKYIENMSLKLIELGVDPNTLKQHPSSTLSYDLVSNNLISQFLMFY